MTEVLCEARNFFFNLFLLLVTGFNESKTPPPPLKLNDPTLKPTKGEISESQTKRSKTVFAVEKKNYKHAIEK